MQVTTELKLQFDSYTNTAEYNDMLWKTFTVNLDGVPFLRAHRDWVEQNSWGYGDRAFHYMWYLLLKDDVLARQSPSVLEIGVYKGQVISLWALIAQQLRRPVEITAISPFEGSKPWLALKVKMLLGRLKRRTIQWVSYLRLEIVSHFIYRTARLLSSFFDHKLIRDNDKTRGGQLLRNCRLQR